MSLCVGVCRHVLAGCFFVSIYVDMCRQSFCVSAVGHPKNIQKVKVRKSLKKGCNAGIYVCFFLSILPPSLPFLVSFPSLPFSFSDSSFLFLSLNRHILFLI